MARKDRKSNGQGTKRPRLRFFFLNGDLHKKLEINRGKDMLVAWNYPKGKRMSYVYSDVLNRHKPAFTTPQVCEIINRSYPTLWRVMEDGSIEIPQAVYSLDENRRILKYMWSEEDILNTLDYFASVHRGRPRKDGRVTGAANLPTPREVRAMIHQDGYALGIMRDGQFIPTWRAKEYL